MTVIYTARLSRRRVAGRPAFEFFAAVLQQAVVIREIKVEAVLRGCVILAIIVAMTAAYGWSNFVNVTAAANQ
jgi:hypothetical protein